MPVAAVFGMKDVSKSKVQLKRKCIVGDRLSRIMIAIRKKNQV